LFADLQETDTFSFERQLAENGFCQVAGTDEVGRGPLAGPVVAASVILPAACDFAVFDDSKKLSAARRDLLYERLREIKAVSSVAIVSEREIERINILQASLLAMRLSMESLAVEPDFLLVDGRHKAPVSVPQYPLIKGDARSASIAAASIIAKVTRDRIMVKLHEKYPVYNFKQNKGYPTKEHRLAIVEHGPCPCHRKTFARVKEFLK